MLMSCIFFSKLWLIHIYVDTYSLDYFDAIKYLNCDMKVVK